MAYFECTIGAGGDGSVLTVTCFSGFAGLTISITNGVDTFSEVCPSSSPYEVVFDGLANGTWTLSTVYNGATYTQTVIVNSSTVFYPTPDGATATPTDDIQTWLYCANIWDKNYTTIAEVLADASTLQALIASSNAADYMARSTSWASNVTADSSAMTYIGANDYCADALLADSTWLNAICDSTYFESVLNVKIPTMTSNSAPSGAASASSSISSQQPYLAFDNNDSSQWGANTATFPAWVQYKFATAMCAKKVRIRPNKIATLKIQASNNGTNFTDLTNNISVTDGQIKTINLSNEDSYLYYRLNCVSGNSSGNGAYVYTFQVYGRA